jgi:uncharacterized protein DUF4058
VARRVGGLAMANPFPGIDPYVEARGYWNDFRVRFLVETSYTLLWRLNNYYDTRVDGKEWTITTEGEPGPDGRPVRFFEEMIERWVEVRRYDNSIVTVIELLRPEHLGRRRRDYLARRETWVSRDIHLVELDFLLDGRRARFMPGRSASPCRRSRSRWTRPTRTSRSTWRPSTRRFSIGLTMRECSVATVRSAFPSPPTTSPGPRRSPAGRRPVEGKGRGSWRSRGSRRGAGGRP